MVKKLVVICSLLALVMLSGCTNADKSRREMGDSVIVFTNYAGEKLTYYSIGRVKSESDSDGWYFMDKKTNKGHILSGGSIDIQPIN